MTDQTQPPAAAPEPAATEPQKPSRAKKLARAVGVPLAFVVAASAYGAYKSADRNEDGEVTKGGDVSTAEIRVGDCVMLPKEATTAEGTEVSELTAVPCQKPHDAESFAIKEITEATYPGETKVIALADSYCAAQFGTFVGVAYDKSKLELSYLFPTKDSWAQGDRDLKCLVHKPEGQSTGSLKGSKL